jgi:hypothetical protein
MNTRYLLQQILAGNRALTLPIRKNILCCLDLSSLSKVCNCEYFVKDEKKRQQLDVQQLIQQEQQHQSTKGGKIVETIETKSRNIDFLISPPTSRGILSLCNNRKWPGIVSSSSHDYSSKYFDENYYTAFKRNCADIDILNENCIIPRGKKSFVYSSFS